MQQLPDLDTSPPEGLDSFLSKVDEVTALINEIKTSENTADVLSKADRYIEKEGEGTVVTDRTVINKAASNAETPPPGAVPTGMTLGDAMTTIPAGASNDQAGFMAAFEKDANERAARRKKRASEALIPKNKGNDAFKAQDYDTAIKFYLEATLIDPANPLLYTNAAQAYLKQGNFESAAERCEIAIRADEKCVKGHLRLGLANVGLGKYKEAKANFKQAKLLSPKKQHLMFDKHIEDAVLAEEIAARERKFLTETAAAEGATPSADSDALKSIERGCAQMADGGLTAEQFRLVTIDLIKCIRSLHHQDLFRLRQGTRAMSQKVCKKLMGEMVAAGSNAKATASTLQLLLICILDNEASRRDVFCKSTDELKLCFGLVACGNTGVRAKAFALLKEACNSPRVREFVVKADKEVGIFQALHKKVLSGDADAVAAFELATKMAQEQAFRDAIQPEFASALLPRIQTCISQGGAVASAAMKYLLQLSAGAEIRGILAGNDILAVLQAMLPVLVQLASKSSENVVTLCNFLGLLTNVSLHPEAAEFLRGALFTAFVAELFGLSSAVKVRAATLLCRLVTQEAYVDGLAASGLLSTLTRLQVHADFELEYADVFARIVIKCAKVSHKALEFCIDEDVMAIFVPLLKGKHTKAIGNVALGIAELANSKQVCARLVGSTVVADLMLHARKEKTQITENCAVALARLAAGDPAHLLRLKQLDGMEVIHSRSKTPAR